ncbi:DEAD/DEAH box helicase [Gynuella sunshinyii]|uniref:DNA or RNA helicase of superfamily II n=1 Tax=Gynuella sunshinyii YC6258 TaxID=1445510 RepID=A0A0C5VFY9_9GAMM|nr:DEAD/DEAH box helicase family protein [Gynuella sunshinyii]AJQ92288.1 DNA or RNA helicase of superfamily II [Gynuella sunshinyii YC6258]
MRLRQWQSEAVTSALQKYRAGSSHFLCLATPGAGKSLMAAFTARELLNAGDIDLIFCFTPSVNISNSFRYTLEKTLKRRMDGLIGSTGQILTYQSMASLDVQFWELLTSHRTLVIFDEIHHCAGDRNDNANVWGQTIIRHIQGQATYTMALTGTPWRSDRIPIALASYCHHGSIQCDYRYGLGRAIKDGVCRIPKITAVDNNQITITHGSETENYRSFSQLLQGSKCSYQQLLDEPQLIRYLIKTGEQKLMRLRKESSDAGGLIVATSVAHAKTIADILHQETGEHAMIATYLHEDAQDAINQFRHSKAKWIISVGMISEGTDIPRLKVCCYLSRIKTELYFRQVLGRILRAQTPQREEAYFFMPAEPSLMEFAQRLSEDIPNVHTVSVHNMDNDIPISMLPDTKGIETENQTDNEAICVQDQRPIIQMNNLPQQQDNHLSTVDSLSSSYEADLRLFGRFKVRLISTSTQSM